MTSTDDVKNWINSIKGTYLPYDQNNGVQCYDVFNQYGLKFWNRRFVGYADPGDYWYHATLISGWSRIGGCKIADMKYGDVIMFGTANGAQIGVYGHVGIVTTNGNMIDENGLGRHDPVTERSITQVMGWTPAPYIGVLRPNLTDNENGNVPLTPEQSFHKKLVELHYSLSSISAIMGSAYYESGSFIPMAYEGGGGKTMDFKTAISTGWSHGWGLIQWTPPSKIKGYPEWNLVNTAETQADIIDDGFNPTRHKWWNDAGGTSLSVIAEYQSSSGWENVDWNEVISYNFEYNKFINGNSNVETKLAYFVICCERPNFSDGVQSYNQRLSKAKEYMTRDWSKSDGGTPNKPDGNTGDNSNTQDTVKEADDPDNLMVLMQGIQP